MKVVRKALCAFLIFILSTPVFAITPNEMKQMLRELRDNIKTLNIEYRNAGQFNANNQQHLAETLERYNFAMYEFGHLSDVNQTDALDLRNLLHQLNVARNAFDITYHRFALIMDDGISVFPELLPSVINMILSNGQIVADNAGTDWWRWGFTVAITGAVMVVATIATIATGYVSYNLYPIINGKKGEKSIWDIAKDVAKLIADVFEYCTGNKKQNHRRDDHDRDPDPGFFKRENNVYSRG